MKTLSVTNEQEVPKGTDFPAAILLFQLVKRGMKMKVG